MDLPAEIRQQIIKRTLQAERKNEGRDFSVTAWGLNCHTMDQFSLFFVNTQLYAEAIPIVYANCDIVLYAQVSHQYSRDDQPCCVPKMLANFAACPALKKLVQKVAVEIEFVIGQGKFPEGSEFLVREPLPRTNSIPPSPCVSDRWNSDDQLTPINWIALRRFILDQSISDLHALVNAIVRELPSRKSLSIVLNTNDIRWEDLKVVLGLFAVKDDLAISLEETGTVGMSLNDRFFADNYYGYMTEKMSVGKYREIVENAAAEGSQEWFLIASPVSDVFKEFRSRRGPGKFVTVWRRRRVWSRVSAKDSGG